MSAADADVDPDPIGDGCCVECSVPAVRDARWHRTARQARLLSWLSLGYMAVEGAVAIAAAVAAGSVALLGFGLDSAIEGLASVIVIWRFTGSRTLSATAEARARTAVAVTFFLLAPYVAGDATIALLSGRPAAISVVGIGLSAASVIVMPLPGSPSGARGRDWTRARPAAKAARTCCAYVRRIRWAVRTSACGGCAPAPGVPASTT
jgi:hypothetical protein